MAMGKYREFCRVSIATTRKMGRGCIIEVFRGQEPVFNLVGNRHRSM